MIDVINKKCINPGCTKQPHYNIPDEKKEYSVLNIKKWNDNCYK